MPTKKSSRKPPVGKVTRKEAQETARAKVRERTAALLNDTLSGLISTITDRAKDLEPYLESAIRSADRIAVEVRSESARARRQAALLTYLQAVTMRQSLLQSYHFAAEMLKMVTSRDDVAVGPLARGYEAALRSVLDSSAGSLSPLEREQTRHLKEIFASWPYHCEAEETQRCAIENKRHERVQKNLLASGKTYAPEPSPLGDLISQAKTDLRTDHSKLVSNSTHGKKLAQALARKTSRVGEPSVIDLKKTARTNKR